MLQLFGLPLRLGLVAASSELGACERVVDALQALQHQNGDGAATIRLQKRGFEPFAFSHGVLQHGSLTPMADDSLFEVASITKTFVSTLILKKIVAGDLMLETPVTSVLKSLPKKMLVVDGEDQTDSITIEQLLTHTSGLPNFWNGDPQKTSAKWYQELGLQSPKIGQQMGLQKQVLFRMAPLSLFEFHAVTEHVFNSSVDAERIWTPAEVLEMIPQYTPTPVGQFHYADTNFMVLGLAVEQLYQKSLSDAIRLDLVEQLLGSPPADTFMRYDVSSAGHPLKDLAAKESKPYERLAHRYHDEKGIGRYDMTCSDPHHFPGNKIVPSRMSSADWGSGGLVTSASELGRFWAALMEANTAPWEEVRNLLVKSTTYPRTADQRYGYGVYNMGGFLGHDGAGGSAVFYHLDSGVSVAATCNVDVFMADWVKSQLDDILTCAGNQPNEVTVLMQGQNPKVRHARSVDGQECDKVGMVWRCRKRKAAVTRHF